MTIGTLPYMSPEQIQGSARHGTTDFYSLGCVLYECLTGVRLFRGSEEAMWRAKLRKEVPVEAERLSHYPELLRRLLGDLLVWPPEKRPANARVVLTRLEEAVSPPDIPQTPGIRWPSPRTMWIGAGGLAVVIFVIVVSLGTLEPKDVRARAGGSSAPGPLRSSSLPKPASATTQKDPSARDHQGGETSSPGPPAPNPTPPSSPVSQTPRPTTPLKEGRMTLRVGVQGGLAPRAKLAVNGDQFTASVPFATSLLVKEGDILTVRIRDRENQFVEDTKTITAHIDGQATITFEVRR
jgi:serine/threonine-protein kinase